MARGESRREVYKLLAYSADGGKTWKTMQNSGYKVSEGTAPLRAARKALKSIFAAGSLPEGHQVDFVLKKVVPKDLTGEEREKAKAKKLRRYTGTVRKVQNETAKTFTLPASNMSELRQRHNMTEGEIRSKGLDKPLVIRQQYEYKPKADGLMTKLEFDNNIAPLITSNPAKPARAE